MSCRRAEAQICVAVPRRPQIPRGAAGCCMDLRRRYWCAKAESMSLSSVNTSSSGRSSKCCKGFHVESRRGGGGASGASSLSRSMDASLGLSLAKACGGFGVSSGRKPPSSKSSDSAGCLGGTLSAAALAMVEAFKEATTEAFCEHESAQSWHGAIQRRSC